jgi:ParB family chromosome partitioning protein
MDQPHSSLTEGRDRAELDIDKLVPFSNHPFRLYEGDRMADMVESIRDNGVMVPIIVRRGADDLYEILAGHNRMQAAKQAGLTTVPAIIREGITDDDALIIVTESNTHQRSLSDMLPSELARALQMQLEAYKRLKRRGMYVEFSEKGVEPASSDDYVESASMQHLPKSRDFVARKQGFGKDQVRYYIRLNQLIPELLMRVDNREIALRAAVSLSYLKKEEQDVIEVLLAAGKVVDINKAEKLRAVSEHGRLEEEAMHRILDGTFGKKEKTKSQSVRLNPKFLNRFFDKKQSQQEITTYVETAVAF